MTREDGRTIVSNNHSQAVCQALLYDTNDLISKNLLHRLKTVKRHLRSEIKLNQIFMQYQE
jgi:hypothetical protein